MTSIHVNGMLHDCPPATAKIMNDQSAGQVFTPSSNGAARLASHGRPAASGSADTTIGPIAHTHMLIEFVRDLFVS